MKIAKPKLPKFSLASFESKKKLASVVAGVVVLFMAFALGVILNGGNDRTDKNSQAVIQKVDELNKPGVGCDEVINKIGNESPEKYNQEAQKKLLEQQFNCYSELGNMERTNDAASKLKVIYEKEGDKQAVAQIEQYTSNQDQNRKILEEDAKHTKP